MILHRRFLMSGAHRSACGRHRACVSCTFCVSIEWHSFVVRNLRVFTRFARGCTRTLFVCVRKFGLLTSCEFAKESSDACCRHQLCALMNRASTKYNTTDSKTQAHCRLTSVPGALLKEQQLPGSLILRFLCSVKCAVPSTCGWWEVGAINIERKF